MRSGVPTQLSGRRVAFSIQFIIVAINLFKVSLVRIPAAACTYEFNRRKKTLVIKSARRKRFRTLRKMLISQHVSGLRSCPLIRVFRDQQWDVKWADDVELYTEKVPYIDREQ